MNNREYFEWLFASVDDVIDCEYEPIKERTNNEQNDRERFVEIINDIGKPREHNSQ